LELVSIVESCFVSTVLSQLFGLKTVTMQPRRLVDRSWLGTCDTTTTQRHHLLNQLFASAALCGGRFVNLTMIDVPLVNQRRRGKLLQTHLVSGN
jgi:hypothetical protein